jgi:predicted phage-related endonuclease
MMAASSKVRRNELLHMKATGSEREICEWVQKNLFDKGHAQEATSRVIVERRIGEDLYPATATDDAGWLLASFDGMTMMGDVLYEHKMWNESLAAAVRAGELEPEYYWQLEQQLLVSKADRVIFVVSDGTEEKFESMEYRAVPGRAAQLVAGWTQFESDLDNFTPTAFVQPLTGKAPETLPALHIEVTGAVTASNLEMFKAHSLEVFESINTDLQTDQHFVDAEQAVKWCGEVEERLAAAKQHALSQTESIDALFRTIDEITAEARAKRLMLDKLVKARKVSIRDEIVHGAAQSLREHISQIDASLDGKARLPVISADFAGVIKGKKLISTLRDAADSELARAKIEANQIADRIRTNLRSLLELAADYMFLFHDVQQLVLKQNDDLVPLIKVRISDHKVAEAEKEQETRDRIRQEEQQRLVNESAPSPTGPVRTAPVSTTNAAGQAAPLPQSKSQPTTTTSKPATYQAEVPDFEALIKAVASGQAPISMLQVNWEELDKRVVAMGADFSMPGVKLVQVAA